MEGEPWRFFTCGGKSILLAAVPLCRVGQYVHWVYWLFIRYEGSSCLCKTSCAGKDLPFKPFRESDLYLNVVLHKYCCK